MSMAEINFQCQLSGQWGELMSGVDRGGSRVGKRPKRNDRVTDFGFCSHGGRMDD
jgi:hypothetical protein